MEGSMQQNLIKEKLIEYYTNYYRNVLSLPDWHSRVTERLSEEDLESKKIKRIEKMIGNFKGKILLNVGCGTGGFNIEAFKKGAKIFAIEPEKDAIFIARLKADKFGINKKNIVNGVAEKIPFRDNQFDIVYCFSVVEHVNNLHRSLKEMIRVCKKGGKIYIETRDYRGFYEGHYKMFWLPLFPKKIAAIYLKIRKRNPDYLFNGIRYVTLPEIENLLKKTDKNIKIINYSTSPSKLKGAINFLIYYYLKLLQINPNIELIIQK